MSRRFVTWYWATAFAVLGLWLIGAYVLLPRLIRSAYDGSGFLSGMLSGRDEHPVDRYLDYASRLSNVGTGTLAGLAVAGFALWAFRGPIRRLLRTTLRSNPCHSALEAAKLAAGLGIILGLTEALVQWFRFRAFHYISEYNNPDVIWMAPLAQGLVFALITLLFFVLLRGRKHGLSRSFVIVLCTGVGTLGILSGLRLGLPPVGVGLHLWARILLSAGAAAVVARNLGPSPRRRGDIVNAVTPAAIVLALAPALTFGVDRVVEWRSASSLPEAPVGPNVLLIVWDTVRGESLSLHGYGRPTTPRLDEWAIGGVVFDQAVSSTSWTLPAHASLFTGRYPYELSADWEEPLDDAEPTLAELFAERGYATGGFTANLLYTARGSGLDRGFDRYRDHRRSLGTFMTSAIMPGVLARWFWGVLPTSHEYLHRKYAPTVTQEFLDWSSSQDGRPFFAFLNYFDAHAEYELHPELLDSFPEGSAPIRVSGADGSSQPLSSDMAARIDAYDSSIAYVDRSLGELLDALARAGTLERTIVVVVGDHGEHLGDHDLSSHGNSLYAQLVRVPMVVRGPGVPAGLRVESAVSTRDLAATIVALAGDDPLQLAGRSLERFWDGAQTGHPASMLVLSELSEIREFSRPEGDPLGRGPMKSALAGDLHYIRNGDGVEELYDLVTDPHESRNLIRSVSDSVLARYRGFVDSIIVADTLDTSPYFRRGGSVEGSN